MLRALHTYTIFQDSSILDFSYNENRQTLVHVHLTRVPIIVQESLSCHCERNRGQRHLKRLYAAHLSP
jgi:hypothetical protein